MRDLHGPYLVIVDNGTKRKIVSQPTFAEAIKVKNAYDAAGTQATIAKVMPVEITEVEV